MVGPYRLEALLGRGGMGEVYRAADTRKRDRLVAVKLLAREHTDPEFAERFRREAETAAGLRNPHIIAIHDYGEVDGRLFLEMAMVDGVDLGDEIARRGALDPARAVRIVGQVASALDTAHRTHLLHRDVKPSNVLLAEGTDEVFAYLVDFGIARSMAATTLTSTGTTVGTVAYMAPERFTHPRDCDHRVDVYALGCLLYEALAGSPPFRGEDFPSLMYAHLQQPPPAPSGVRDDVPPLLDAVVARALAKRPDDRYPSAGRLAAAARDALRDGARAPTPSAPPPQSAVPTAQARSAPVLSLSAITRRPDHQHLDRSGTVARWLVSRGDTVAVGAEVAEVIVDTTRMRVRSRQFGVVDRLLVRPGAAFDAHQDLLVLAEAPPAPDAQFHTGRVVITALVTAAALVAVVLVVLSLLQS